MEPTKAVLPGSRRMAIWELCVMIAGIAIGLWLFAGEEFRREDQNPLIILTGVLGGLSIIGPPILLWERRRRRTKWGPGEILWFSQGMSAWLLWPPIVAAKLQGKLQVPGPASGSLCMFVYGTPLMAIYVGSALLFGGWIRRGRRRRRRVYSWRERFGLLLTLCWAATGGWVLWILYSGR